MREAARDRPWLTRALSAAVLGALALLEPNAQAAEAMRPASKDEIQSLCRAIAHQQEVEHLDQAIDVAACPCGAMVVRTGAGAPELSGRVTINFPGHTQIETCRAALRGGQVDPQTIDCR